MTSCKQGYRAVPDTTIFATEEVDEQSQQGGGRCSVLHRVIDMHSHSRRSRVAGLTVATVLLLSIPVLIIYFGFDQKDDASSLRADFTHQIPTQAVTKTSSKVAKQVDEDKGATKELFYHEQPVNHFRDENYSNEPQDYWSNRYYQTTKYFGGPGKPIFLIVGGEGATDDGFYYPFITELLAKDLNAAVIQIEHRFYGPYPPVPNATVTELLQLLTVEQALADMVHLVRHQVQPQLGCNIDRSSPEYCPVITVGGSYPGALSALFRVVYPDIVDIAYASSGPLLMYAQSQSVDFNVYYDIVTDSAETTSPGCAAAVRQTLEKAVKTIKTAANMNMAAQAVNVCIDGIPDYITSQTMLADAIVEIASFKFADDNMENYPPGPTSPLYKTCQLFLRSGNPLQDFLYSLLPPSETHPTCFDISSQVPKSGTTLDDTDGEYLDGMMWDFQTCTDLVFILGFSERSMFPAKSASYDGLTHHCRERFGVTPRPFELVEKWHFDDLSNKSYILFVNGEQDIWSGGSILHNVSETVLAINIADGAHHSELNHKGLFNLDTASVKAIYTQIQNILATWLLEQKVERL